jgi:hypothetical protein
MAAIDSTGQGRHTAVARWDPLGAAARVFDRASDECSDLASAAFLHLILNEVGGEPVVGGCGARHLRDGGCVGRPRVRWR